MNREQRQVATRDDLRLSIPQLPDPPFRNLSECPATFTDLFELPAALLGLAATRAVPVDRFLQVVFGLTNTLLTTVSPGPLGVDRGNRNEHPGEQGASQNALPEIGCHDCLHNQEHGQWGKVFAGESSRRN